MHDQMRKVSNCCSHGIDDVHQLLPSKPEAKTHK